MKKIVEYDSKLNNLSFGKFKEKELDLFFSICYRLKNEGVNEITMTFQELKELSNYSKNDIKRFSKDLETTYTKLLDIKLELILSPYVKEKFVLFTGYRIDTDKKEMSVQLHQKYRFVLNDIARFTKFDLQEFTSLKSSYARNVFRLLKQFDGNKENWYQVKLDEFKMLLDIPNSYKMSHIDSFVLSPILEQLAPYFNGLKLEKIKRGVKVDSLKFTWKAKKKQVEKIQAIKKRSSIGEKELEEHKQFEKEKEIPLDPLEKIDKIKISEADYKELYKKYLLEIEQEPTPINKKIFDTMNKIKYEVIEFEQTKIYTVEDIPEEKLLDKNGNKLKGIFLTRRIDKILEEMNKNDLV